MTEGEAVALAKSGWWKRCTPEQAASFQLNEPRLCMDFGDFQLAMDKLLGRATWTHEYADANRLRLEAATRNPPAVSLEMVRAWALGDE